MPSAPVCALLYLCWCISWVCWSSLVTVNSCTGEVWRHGWKVACFYSLAENRSDTVAVHEAGVTIWYAVRLFCRRKNGKIRRFKFLESSAVNTFHLTISLKETVFHESFQVPCIYLFCLYIHPIKRCAYLFLQALWEMSKVQLYK